jgi:hypothetical protein
MPLKHFAKVELGRAMGCGGGGFLVQNRAVAQGVLTRWSSMVGVAPRVLAVVSSNLRWLTVACSNRLLFKKRVRATPRDLTDGLVSSVLHENFITDSNARGFFLRSISIEFWKRDKLGLL